MEVLEYKLQERDCRGCDHFFDNDGVLFCKRSDVSISTMSRCPGRVIKMSVLNRYQYILQHWLAYIRTYRIVVGRVPLRAYFHDLDKLFMVTVGMDYDRQIISVHRKISRHHLAHKNVRINDIVDAIIDWECARFTKPDKPLNAKETCAKYYPEYKEVVFAICDFLKI